MKYFISDLHLFHTNALFFDNRPFDDMQHMLDAVANNWNSTINNSDTVYILGDVSMNCTDALIAYIAKLRGHKILVKGNHDDIRDHRYATLFDEICDYKEITEQIDNVSYKLVLCHYPIFSWKNMGRGTILLYGHTHNSKEDQVYQETLHNMAAGECYHIYDKAPKAINVGCMKPYIDYKPRTLAEILNNEIL